MSGRAELPLGARVTGPADVLTDLQQIDPIYVYFSPSDLELLRFRRERAEGKLVFPKGKLQVEVRLSDGTPLPSKGRSTSPTCPSIPAPAPSNSGPSSGTPSTSCSRASSCGCASSASPGAATILVPQRAVLQGLAGAYVYVLTEGDTARARTVTASSWEGNGWVIESGLNAGERVVVDGTQRVIAGQPVRIAPPADSTAADTTP